MSRHASGSGHTPTSHQQSDPTFLEFHTTKLPDSEMLDRMIVRLEKLLNFVPVRRALALTSNNVYKDEILRLVELRVVRECNLPDNYTNFLRVRTCLHTRFLLPQSEPEKIAGETSQESKKSRSLSKTQLLVCTSYFSQHILF